MENGYYSPYTCNNNNYNMPPHLFFFFLVLLLFMGLTWYINYESVFESLINQLKLALMVSPLLLLLAVHWLSGEDREKVPFLVQFPEREALHRAGGSPWGVGLVLVLVMFMISYQSYFHELLFPFLGR